MFELAYIVCDTRHVICPRLCRDLGGRGLFIQYAQSVRSCRRHKKRSHKYSADPSSGLAAQRVLVLTPPGPWFKKKNNGAVATSLGTA
jgi:hypothetical protein